MLGGIHQAPVNEPAPPRGTCDQSLGADDRTIESLLGAAAPDPGHLQQPGLLL